MKHSFHILFPPKILDTKEQYLQDSNAHLDHGKTSKDFPKGLVLSFVTNKDGETKYLFTYENLDAFDDDDVKIIKMKTVLLQFQMY